MLLVKRSAERAFYPGVWDVIGGHCAEGETPGATLIREAEEEIGITPCTFEEIAVLGEPDPAKHGEGRYHIFVVTDWAGEPRLRGPEHSELRWLSLEQALILPLAHPEYPALFRSVLRPR